MVTASHLSTWKLSALKIVTAKNAKRGNIAWKISAAYLFTYFSLNFSRMLYWHNWKWANETFWCLVWGKKKKKASQCSSKFSPLLGFRLQHTLHQLIFFFSPFGDLFSVSCQWKLHLTLTKEQGLFCMSVIKTGWEVHMKLQICPNLSDLSNSSNDFRFRRHSCFGGEEIWSK